MLRNIWRFLFVVLILFTTPLLSTVYSRERLLSLRHRAALLSKHDCLFITHLGLRRRGCRAGLHKRCRLLAARGMTSSVIPGDTPAVFVNNNQHTGGRRFSQQVGGAPLSTITVPTQFDVSVPPPQCPDYLSTLQPSGCSPVSFSSYDYVARPVTAPCSTSVSHTTDVLFSNSHQEIIHSGLQSTSGALTSPLSTCVWESVPEHFSVSSVVPATEPFSAVNSFNRSVDLPTEPIPGTVQRTSQSTLSAERFIATPQTSTSLNSTSQLIQPSTPAPPQPSFVYSTGTFALSVSLPFTTQSESVASQSCLATSDIDQLSSQSDVELFSPGSILSAPSCLDSTRSTTSSTVLLSPLLSASLPTSPSSSQTSSFSCCIQKPDERMLQNLTKCKHKEGNQTS